MHSVQAELSALYSLLYRGSVLNSPVRSEGGRVKHAKRIYGSTDIMHAVRSHRRNAPKGGAE